MAILNPDHLFEQASRLLAPPPAGHPRQVDLRRAISAAYYGVFHATLAAAADEVVGKTKRSTSSYALAYRSINHNSLKELCARLKNPAPPDKYIQYIPANGVGTHIQTYCAAVVELQEKRHAADYDPSIRVNTSDALVAVSTARSALSRFARANAAQRKAFLSLLLFPPR